VGTVPANGTSRLPVPVPARIRRARLVAVVGQADASLRVITVPFTIGRPHGKH
jgi:hypothetical protein